MESFLDIAKDLLLDATLDTLNIVPFLLITYLVMEWLEHKTTQKSQESIRKAGAAGPAVGALLGAVPQCGFSAAASTLWSGRVITLGTLFAVFLSTSDEMLPIFIAQQVPLSKILPILGMKVAIGMVMGFAVDLLLRLVHHPQNKLQIDELCERAGCHCDERCSECEIDCATCDASPDHGFVRGAFEGEGHEHQHAHSHAEHQHGAGSVVMSAVKHTVQITLFVFAITLALNVLIEGLGGDSALAAIVGGNEVLSIFASALFGLIPNCAASVTIAQLYVDGVLGFPAMMSGLLVSAGVGLLVLVRTNNGVRKTIVVIAGLFAMGVFWGLLFFLLGVTI